MNDVKRVWSLTLRRIKVDFEVLAKLGAGLDLGRLDKLRPFVQQHDAACETNMEPKGRSYAERTYGYRYGTYY